MHTAFQRPALVATRLLPAVAGLGGAVAGFVAGATTLLLWPVAALVAGDSWNLPQALATTLFGGAALDATLATAALWVGAAVVLGSLFGSIYRRRLRLTTDFGLAVYAGLAYGLLVSVAGAAAAAALGLDTGLAAGMGVWTAQSVGFGILLGLIYTAVRPAPYHGPRAWSGP